MYQLGLIGYPLGHSLSPVIHQAALQAMGLPGEYRLYPVAPLPQGQAALIELLSRVRQGELDGLNVTIPHKPSVLPLVDGLTASAAGIGAVNTLFREEGRLLGDNTDAPGFLADLERLGVIQPGKALVLGAGGSARSVAFALSQDGWQVNIAARRLKQAKALADELAQPGLGARLLRAVHLSREALASLPAELIVNTTPVGMAPLLDGNPWPVELALPASAFVYDLIYNPAETLLLRAAKRAGLSCSNGLGMLVEQAALSLELWTRQPVPRQAMWRALEPFIAASQSASRSKSAS